VNVQLYCRKYNFCSNNDNKTKIRIIFREAKSLHSSVGRMCSVLYHRSRDTKFVKRLKIFFITFNTKKKYLVELMGPMITFY